MEECCDRRPCWGIQGGAGPHVRGLWALEKGPPSSFLKVQSWPADEDKEYLGCPPNMPDLPLLYFSRLLKPRPPPSLTQKAVTAASRLP